MQGSLFFNYQLPPRRFWNAIIDQGLNITDLIVVSHLASAQHSVLMFIVLVKI